MPLTPDMQRYSGVRGQQKCCGVPTVRIAITYHNGDSLVNYILVICLVIVDRWIG